MNVPVIPRQNRLLAALPAPDLDRLHPGLELIWMPLGKVLHESGDRLHHVYFPTTAIVSLLYVMEDGRSAEVALIGNDGMIGIALFMGGETMPNRAVVLNAGYAYRLRMPVLKHEFDRCGGRRSGALNRLLLRYAQALVTQMAQTAVCNRHHSVAQQLCRWLLLSIDRSSSNELILTQELIANTLGVRREGVTEAAGRLQAAGLIKYNRGHITVLDRAGLAARACECYEVVRNEYDRLLPRPALAVARARTSDACALAC
ncbi:MAG: Crp/Fnr family transcriptional regulator [Rhodocyclales bacterium GWA2_65_20]|nr:MAG: Crp/Fnr family transcriptional regulator [Rhodocyclales bacterium GWA2_65_20]